MTLIAAVAAFAVMLVGGAGTAAAQDATTKASKVVAMTGTAKNGKKFNGTFTIKRFTQSGGKVYAVGQLKGKLKGRNVKRNGVRVPATLASQAAAQSSQGQPNPPIGDPIPPTANACTILRLDLGAINLNLLGLRLQTRPINLLLEGVRGPGNLLGNLLCAITGLLDPQPATPPTPASQLAQILNAILALLPRTAAA
jgi:hypothetical protein